MMKIDLEGILEGVRSARIGIIGDFCLDVYWDMDRSRSEKSVETGLATEPVRSQRFSLGGAGNVAANMKAMGVGKVDVFGVAGEDPFGHQMRLLMDELSIGHSGLIVQDGRWETHAYIKRMSDGAEQNRIDFGNFNSLSAGTCAKLLKAISAKIPELDIVVVNQQVMQGIHSSASFRGGLKKLIAASRGKTFLLDSRDWSESYGGTVRKMNAYEASRLCGVKCDPMDVISEDDAKSAGLKLHGKWKKTLFVTRGERGCLVFDGGKTASIPGLHIADKTDPVGAGDSFLAGIAAAMAAGSDPAAAAAFANFVAGVTVQKIGRTGTATPDEIRAIGLDPDHVFRPEKADSIRSAKYLAKSEIEIVAEMPRVEKISHAIFDNDGTISVLREGWEKIMEPMMVKAILGPAYDKAGETEYHRVVERVRKFIDGTTGVQTLVQMQGLVRLVREFGYVPAGGILDEFGYKAIYNKELLEMVKVRVDKLRRGELSAEDYTMKGSVPFLKRLSRAGVRLYLASGTDEDDVIREAKELGYASLFGERIYGSVGDVNKEAKKIVMDRIVADIGPENAGRIVTFGDGPVELREIKKRGGLAIGVASDEIRRFGLNPRKRGRLVRAGSDIIIPDFSQSGRLCEILSIR